MRGDPTTNRLDGHADAESSFSLETLDERRPMDRRWHWTVLAGGTAILAAGLLVDVRADGALFLRGLPNFPLPVICPLRRFFGISCPTCGMTRSLVHLLQGRPSTSFADHRLGWLVLALIVVQLPYRAWCLAGGRELPPHPRLVELALLGFLLLLVVNWLVP